jgi:hypothetical protein
LRHMWQLHWKGICCPHILCNNIWRQLHPWSKIGQWPLLCHYLGGLHPWLLQPPRLWLPWSPPYCCVLHWTSWFRWGWSKGYTCFIKSLHQLPLLLRLCHRGTWHHFNYFMILLMH